MTDIKSKKIGILAGGPSSEREISLKSGQAVYDALKKEGCNVIFMDINEDIEGLKADLRNKGIEIVFIALHGRFGEDGTVQRVLEDLGIPYTGSGPEASRLALDKIASKEIFAKHKIDIPPHRVFKKGEDVDVEELGLPVVIKPRSEGSSIGLSIVRDKKDLKKAVDKAYEYSNIVVVEKYIKGPEITVGILGDEPLCVIQIIPGSEFYDYEAKYSKPDTKYLVPAPIEKEYYERSQNLGKLAHRILKCKGFSRVDMILGDDKKIYVLEINTIPGLTERSLLPKAAEYAGISFGELCKKIVALAID